MAPASPLFNTHIKVVAIRAGKWAFCKKHRIQKKLAGGGVEKEPGY